VAVALVLLGGVLAGCSEEGTGGGSGVAGPQLGQPIQLANCTDWQNGSVEERLGTIKQIREYFGGSVPGTGGTGSVLDDEQAYDLFEGFCRAEYARGFTLYRLYTRAAAFSDLEPPAPSR
jgi:hypothetical protein